VPFPWRIATPAFRRFGRLVRDSDTSISSLTCGDDRPDENGLALTHRQGEDPARVVQREGLAQGIEAVAPGEVIVRPDPLDQGGSS